MLSLLVCRVESTPMDDTGYCCTVQYICGANLISRQSMATGKAGTLTFRIEPGQKEARHAGAERAHRSIVNMIAVLIRDHRGHNGIAISEPGAQVHRRLQTTTGGTKIANKHGENA